MLKLDHLKAERQKEINEKKSVIVIPEELLDYKECIIYNENKINALCKENVEGVVVGGVSIDDDEKSVLKLNPKFAVLSRLDDESIETDIEVAIAKLKYEIRRQEEIELLESVELENVNEKKQRLDVERDSETENEINEAKERQVFDPIRKVFDYTKRRTTDLAENTKVHLPKLVSAKEESQLEMICYDLLWKEYI